MAMWDVLRTFGIFYDNLVNFVFIWDIFPGNGIIYQEKSGNPGFFVLSEPKFPVKKKEKKSCLKCDFTVQTASYGAAL
jgi:hypothetical protein